MIDRILVIRLSAMGDVAMTVPVITQLLDQHPSLHLDILTRGAFHPMFPSNERIKFIELDLNKKHKGFPGLIRLFSTLRKNNYSAVADLHDVLRSQVIRTLFKITGTKTAHINKGRKEKALLTQKENKAIKQLTTSHVRYAQVFDKLGFPISLNKSTLNVKPKGIIGIAPFAAHRQKMWPIDKSISLLNKLINETEFQIYLFGGGPAEKQILHEMAQTSTRVLSTAGVSFNEQLKAMSALSLLVSMDSANMHLASNLNIPVISIWGATHPYAGFLGYNQSPDNCIQREDLACRPCSIFGNKKCWRGDWACLDIEVDLVFNQILELTS